MRFISPDVSRNRVHFAREVQAPHLRFCFGAVRIFLLLLYWFGFIISTLFRGKCFKERGIR